MDKLVIVIPAIKKNAVIPDQLVKKLNGITLIQRAINTAKNLSDNILIITDSQEISLIAERNGLRYYYDSKLKVDSNSIRENLTPILLKKIPSNKNILLYRANTPLVDSGILKKAFTEFLSFKREKIIFSSKTLTKNIFVKNNQKKISLVSSENIEELRSFQIFSVEQLKNKDPDYALYEIPREKAVEIESYQDWWVCEKILSRKKIVFNVVGSQEIGMGHIYRSLTLAHEINNHEIIFVCKKEQSLVVEKIASKDYQVFTYESETEILNLKPDMVINDILNTEEDFIKKLKEKGVKVINFEDLGRGSKYADYTINELYEKPKLKGDNYLWGSDYFFLRDEFDIAKPHVFQENINEILITFGGTDQNNLTLITLKNILPLIKKEHIKVRIVCGSGYLYKKELEDIINEHKDMSIHVTYATEVISRIMEKTQIAICSNGRTVYELADMNIPSIVISHHERENGHSFAQLDKGFINLGVVDKYIGRKILKAFEKLLYDRDYRYLLFLNISKYGFRQNKKKIIKIINSLI